MAETKKIGVVTVTYNSAGFIDDFMNSMLQQTHRDFILYIIDNASSDDTLERIRHFNDPRIQTIANTDNLGVAAANNQGINLSLSQDCDFVLLINNDTIFNPDMLERLIDGASAYNCDMIVPKITYFDPPDIIWCAGGTFTRWNFYSPFHYGDGQKDIGQFDRPRRIDYCPTCCMLIKAGVFDRIGLMDEKYFVYFDDLDFCYRAMRAGLSMYYHPEATMKHIVSGSTGGIKSPFAITYGTRNKIYFVRKHINRLIVPFLLLAYQTLLVAKLVLRKDSWDIFKLKQRAFRQGLTL